MAPEPAGDPATDPSADPIEFRVGGPADVETCRRVLRQAYDRDTFSADWYRWKHVESPWGPSTPYIAEDPAEVLGVVFGLPWNYSVRRADGSIEQVDGVRFVDGATLPPARGRRVLPSLCAMELERWDAGRRPGVLVATATPAAQRSHTRNGASTLTPIRSVVGLSRTLRPARLVTGDAVLDSLSPELAAPATPGVLGTAWSPAALRWRTDRRSARTYDAAALAAGDGANGLVFRIDTRRGLRMLVPLVTWGSDRDRHRLQGAVAFRHGCPVVLAPVGASAADGHLRPLRPTSESIVCVWDLRPAGEARDATRDDAWAFTMADLEGLI